VLLVDVGRAQAGHAVAQHALAVAVDDAGLQAAAVVVVRGQVRAAEMAERLLPALRKGAESLARLL
jgi:hypothetical protein